MFFKIRPYLTTNVIRNILRCVFTSTAFAIDWLFFYLAFQLSPINISVACDNGTRGEIVSVMVEFCFIAKLEILVAIQYRRACSNCKYVTRCKETIIHRISELIIRLWRYIFITIKFVHIYFDSYAFLVARVSI